MMQISLLTDIWENPPNSSITKYFELVQTPPI